jgi:hypothetical protein
MGAVPTSEGVGELRRQSNLALGIVHVPKWAGTDLRVSKSLLRSRFTRVGVRLGPVMAGAPALTVSVSTTSALASWCLVGAPVGCAIDPADANGRQTCERPGEELSRREERFSAALPM